MDHLLSGDFDQTDDSLIHLWKVARFRSIITYIHAYGNQVLNGTCKRIIPHHYFEYKYITKRRRTAAHFEYKKS